MVSVKNQNEKNRHQHTPTLLVSDSDTSGG